MEETAMFVYKCILLFSLTGHCLTQTTVQHCKYTSIHVVNEDGREQVITIKDPESDASCGCQPPQQGTLDSQCQSETDTNTQSTPKPGRPNLQNSNYVEKNARKLFQPTGPDGMPHPTNRIPLTPFQNGAPHWDLAPTVTIFIGDIMSTICVPCTLKSDDVAVGPMLNHPGKFGEEIVDINVNSRLFGVPCTLKSDDVAVGPMLNHPGNERDQPEICSVFKQVPINCLPGDTQGRENVEQCANYLVENNLLPVPTGDNMADNRIAYGHVLIGAGLVDEAVEYFTSLIQEYPNLASAYHGRGMAYSKKGLLAKLAERAIVDFSKASELEPENSEHYQRMAELYLPLGRYPEAMFSVTKAVELSEEPSSRILFLKATLELAAENYKTAEADYRKSLTMGEQPHMIHTFYNLALTLYYRGMLRNSIEMYKELVKLKPQHVEAHCGLAHAYSRLGDYINAYKVFNKSLTLNKDHLLSTQLRGSFLYNNGDVQKALKSFQRCLELAPDNYMCQYMESLCMTSLGQFYRSVKGFTKVTVQKRASIKMSPEFIKSQYIREYSRFLHHNLDKLFLEVDFDGDFPNEFKTKWLKVEPFSFKSYIEQPGLSPSISDIATANFREWPMEIRELICYARTIGAVMHSPTDGDLQNERQELAKGLAAIHVAQAMRDVWQDVGASKTDLTMTWHQMFDIAVRYIRLVNPEEPVFWLDDMSSEDIDMGFSHDAYIIKGHTINVKMMHYFDLVYRLMRTMISVHCGEGEMYPEVIMHELASVETHEQLIETFKKDLFRDQGFVMSTQLYSMKNPSGPKHEGVMLSIAADKVGKMVLSVNLPYNREKANAVHEEMDYIFFELYHELKKLGGRSSEDPDHIINLILSLVYYFLNLSPISHGSSAVAWSVAVGLIMSVGRDVTGRLGSGKLLDIEAALTGDPEVFSTVTKTWMKIKRMKDNPLLRLQHVSATMPILRDVLEAFAQTHTDCWEVFAHSKNIIL